MSNKKADLLGNLNRLAQSSPFSDEQNVASLIVSALENNIISEAASSELEKDCFRFVFGGETVSYDI